jgi:hypothetical protein
MAVADMEDMAGREVARLGGADLRLVNLAAALWVVILVAVHLTVVKPIL